MSHLLHESTYVALSVPRFSTKIPVSDPAAIVSYCLIPPWASSYLFGSINFVSALLQPRTKKKKKILIKHAQLISLLEKWINNYPEYVCYSVSTL